jgi:SEC-C motif
MKIGRNDPCPCGSGQKYKKCCLASLLSEQADDFSYRRYRDIESKLVGRLFQHAAEVFGPTAIEEAWRAFHCWDDAEAFDPDSPTHQIFGPYFLFSWKIDPADTDCAIELEGKTVAESFLQTQRARLTKEEIEILEATRHCTFAFYEITDVRSGKGFTARNVLTEIEYEVVELSGSKGVTRGHVTFGSIFEVQGRHQMLGMSPYLLPPLSIQMLIEVRKDLQKGLKTKKLTDAQVSEFDIELREIYFSLLQPLLNPQMPKLCNTDGDPLVPQTLHFEIESPDRAFAELKCLAEGILTDDQLRSDVKLKNGEVDEAEIPWFKKAKGKARAGSNTVLGRIKIIGRKLTVEVNSDRRAKTIKKKIEMALGEQTKFVTRVIESVEGNMGRGPSSNGPQSRSIPVDQLPPEAMEAVKRMANQHWEKWYNDKIPALNGMTPKQAAKTKEGRELLEALLNFYEHRSGQANNAATNLFQPDIRELRSKLGLK